MTDTQDEYQELFNVYWPIGVAVWLVIAGLVVFFIVRFRSRSRELPSGTDSNKVVEGLYALFVGCIAAFLLYLTFDTLTDLDSQFDRDAAVEVEVTGAKWNWRFEYPELGIVEQGTRERIATLRVPEGEPVDFRASSVDVIHSFWVPNERFKRDVFPGRVTTWQLVFDDPGFHEGAGSCAEFCGLRHTDMKFNVEVLEAGAFERWADRARAMRGDGSPGRLGGADGGST